MFLNIADFKWSLLSLWIRKVLPAFSCTSVHFLIKDRVNCTCRTLRIQLEGRLLSQQLVWVIMFFNLLITFLKESLFSTILYLNCNVGPECHFSNAWKFSSISSPNVFISYSQRGCTSLFFCQCDYLQKSSFPAFGICPTVENNNLFSN